MTVLAPLESHSRYGLKQVVRAEWIKVFSLRSTMWTLLVTVVGTLGVTVLATHGQTDRPSGWYHGWHSWFDPTNQSLTGLALGTLAIGVLGVLAVTGEYGSGTIRSSLAAVPRRPLLLLGKLLVVSAIAVVVSEALTFACFGVGQVILSHGGAPSASLGQPGVLRAVALSGAFLALLGLLGVGLGFIIRHTAGAISAYVAITFLLPILSRAIPGNLGRFMPELMLANSVGAVLPHPDQLRAPVGFLLMALYCTVTLGIATFLFVRRDA
jgi:ABC-2 type transport system permease protein